MGKFFDNKFNNNKQPCNCPACRGVPQDETDVESMMVDIEIGDPEEIISQYFELIADADSPEEVAEILSMLFFEGVEYGTKGELIDDIQMKIEMLNSLQNGK